MIDKLYALPGNGGIALDAECIDIGAKDIEKQVKFALENKVDYAVVAPDDPLSLARSTLLRRPAYPASGRIRPLR